MRSFNAVCRGIWRRRVTPFDRSRVSVFFVVSRHATLLSFVEYDPRERLSRCYYLGAEERSRTDEKARLDMS